MAVTPEQIAARLKAAVAAGPAPSRPATDAEIEVLLAELSKRINVTNDPTLIADLRAHLRANRPPRR